MEKMNLLNQYLSLLKLKKTQQFEPERLVKIRFSFIDGRSFELEQWKRFFFMLG